MFYNRFDVQDVFFKLGATMYTPAVHCDLVSIGNGVKFQHLRSSVFCTEDSVRQVDLKRALENLAEALPQLSPLSEAPLYRFIRIRNREVMSAILNMEGIQNIHGFVIPKATAANMPGYLGLLAQSDHYLVMPIIETVVAFELELLKALRNVLSQEKVRWRVPCIRIGGNDLLSLLNVRRAPDRTIYQTFLQGTIIDIAKIFAPYNFGVAAPVFEGITNHIELAREVISDLNHGLFGKTVIHPSHIAVVEAQYAVSSTDLEMAQRITDPNAPAVFSMHGRMCEVATHLSWAETIIKRYEIYGIMAEI